MDVSDGTRIRKTSLPLLSLRFPSPLPISSSCVLISSVVFPAFGPDLSSALLRSFNSIVRPSASGILTIFISFFSQAVCVAGAYSGHSLLLFWSSRNRVRSWLHPCSPLSFYAATHLDSSLLRLVPPSSQQPKNSPFSHSKYQVYSSTLHL